ncbi:MAG: cation-translocating P-type ATPase [archaeon]
MVQHHNWHSIDIEDTARSLSADIRGLASGDASRRLGEYGKNKLEGGKRITTVEIFLRQFKNFIIYVLIGAAAISYYLGEMLDVWIITFVIFFVAFLGFYQEFRAERSMESLKELSAPHAVVMRDGVKKEILAEEIVPGDVILLEAGRRIPADARIIDATDLKSDESALTGESIPVLKKAGTLPPDVPLAERDNMVFVGTHIVDGIGSALVVSTGMHTEIGKVAKMIEQVGEIETPIKTKLNTLGKRLTMMVLAVCALVVVVQYARGASLTSTMVVVAALAVSGMPESLPAVVTVTLASGVKRMSKHNAIIRVLPTVETLGSATVICTDKTGTLTHGTMTVRKLFANSEMLELTGRGSELEGDFYLKEKAVGPKGVEFLLKAAALCNDAYLEEEKERESEELIVIGDPTEGALLVAAAKGKILQEQIKKEYPRIGEVPFNSDRMRMTTVHTTEKEKKIAFTKGAPEKIIDLCNRIYLRGTVTKMTDKQRKELHDVYRRMGEDALRVLAVSYREVPDKVEDYTETLETGLVFIGLMGMIDPPREEAISAITACKTAGIKVIMITGDNKITAEAIGKELGLTQKGSKIITSAELNKMSDAEFDVIVEDVAIYARASPSDKLRIVSALQKKGHIVAMTGDGVNDAPALKKADVGVAMGKGGTDVAREAADMILTDDNFATIVNAISEGRTIFDNIKKFVYYMLAGNIAEITITATALIFGAPFLPFTALMILWINLVTSDFPAMGLGLEPPETAIMSRPPRNPDENVPSMRLILGLTEVGSIICIGVILLFVMKVGIWQMPLDRARTVAFATLIAFELFHAFNSRSLTQSIFTMGLMSNKPLLVGVAASVATSLFVIYYPPLQSIFGTSALTLWDWARVLAVASTVLIFVELKKHFGREVEYQKV